MMEQKGVFPTPVGMNRTGILSTLFRGRIPHTRGDEPYDYFIYRLAYRIPHTRGDEPLSKYPSELSSVYSPHPWG